MAEPLTRVEHPNGSVPEATTPLETFVGCIWVTAQPLMMIPMRHQFELLGA